LFIVSGVLSSHFRILTLKAPKRAISTRVRNVARLLTSLTSMYVLACIKLREITYFIRLPASTRDLAIHLLIRSSFDDSIIEDVKTGIQINIALNNLLLSIPILEEKETVGLCDLKSTNNPANSYQLHRISKTLFETVSSPTLRSQLVISLPCHSRRAHLFRRQLALAFALNSSRRLTSDVANPALTNHVLVSLTQSPTFTISSDTDYLTLNATLRMLDVALDAGFSDFAFLSKSSTCTATEVQTNERPVIKQVNEKEIEFNAGVDMIVKRIREIMAKVVDTGASHMRRTEAKSTADRMVHRVEASVRTKPKAARDWFSDGREDTVSKAFMESFVGKGKLEATVAVI
jgi:hypothetical protein